MVSKSKCGEESVLAGIEIVIVRLVLYRVWSNM